MDTRVSLEVFFVKTNKICHTYFNAEIFPVYTLCNCLNISLVKPK